MTFFGFGGRRSGSSHDGDGAAARHLLEKIDKEIAGLEQTLAITRKALVRARKLRERYLRKVPR